MVVFETGCGNGSNIFPLLEGDARLIAYAADFSPAAVAVSANFRVLFPSPPLSSPPSHLCACGPLV